MGRGWLKETVNEFNSALEVAQAATLQERGMHDDLQYSGPYTHEQSDTSTIKDMSRTGVIPLV